MTCEEYRRRLMDLLAGDLPDRSALEAHEASCPACAGLRRGMEANERLLRQALPPPLPGDLWPRIAASLGIRGGVRRLRRWRQAAALAAAGVAAAVGLTFVSAPPRGGGGLDIVVKEAGPALGSLVPKYGEVEAVEALAGFPSASRDGEWR